MIIISSDFLTVVQIFLSPQVKQRMITINKLVYTSYLTLLNNVRLSILGNMEISRKSQNFIELLPCA